MFKKILIANRGEIACRVIATAKRLGIATVAVYSDADRDARHVDLADEAVHIGASASRESYLVGEKIIEACRATGAEALHPGYGFLSENAAFARSVEDAGIVFIGPKHAAIAAMGDKIASKELAARAKVNTIPGHNAPIGTAAEAVAIAQRIGYPVMIKASAGGGGKGLRVAANDAEAAEGFESCRNEARNSFGDDRVFIEKFVEQPRHIEIQVLGDAHGNCVYLWERECSIQRRHQKVIEEAPSPFLDDATRAAMGAQAVALARAVGYQSAGTVEFVAGKDRSFYFLEMNTRLQVEHPVTECITGLDLVEQMIRVAAGEKLAFAQSDIARRGWAIECRINAEDPYRNFLPSTGRLVHYRPPPQSLFAGTPAPAPPAASRLEAAGGGVRVDTGVYEGGEIPMFYDSMIAKLIVHAPDRASAIARMRAALDAFVIRGISSNVAFQGALLAHPRFVQGDFTTAFIAQEFPTGLAAPAPDAPPPVLLLALAAVAQLRSSLHQGPARQALAVMSTHAQGERRFTDVVVEGGRDAYVVTIDGQWHALQLHGELRDIALDGSFDGRPFVAQVDRAGLAWRISHHGVGVTLRVLTPTAAELFGRMPVKAPPDLSKLLLSPMPGLLVDVAVTVGQRVQAGERLAAIEAMKMENILFATQDCTVAEICAQRGASLAVDQVILKFA
jgi:propionyl-CoA carboxylase alpha chain